MMEYSIENNIIHIKKPIQESIPLNKIISEKTLDMMDKSIDSLKDGLVSESLVDLERKRLSPDVFTDDEKLLPRIKDFIVNLFKEIFISAGVSEDKIKTIYIIGSILGKYYNDYTDIDCQTVINGDDTEVQKLMDTIWKKYPAGYLYITSKEQSNTHPVNLYVRKYTTDEELYPPTIDGIYDLLSDGWIQKIQPKFIIDYSTYEISMSWIRKIEQDINELKRDLVEYVFYSEGEKNKDKLAIDISQIESYRTMKFKEIIYDLSNIRTTMGVLKDWRTKCQLGMVEEYKEVPVEIIIDYKNFITFDGIITWKLADRFQLISIMGAVRYVFSSYEKNELSKEQLIIELSKVLNVLGTSKHGI
jgi:hypothetical protein